MGSRTTQTWVQAPALPQTSHRILLGSLSFLIYKMGIAKITVSLVFVKIKN